MILRFGEAQLSWLQGRHVVKNIPSEQDEKKLTTARQ
jgi:hypothetical protein